MIINLYLKWYFSENLYSGQVKHGLSQSSSFKFTNYESRDQLLQEAYLLLHNNGKCQNQSPAYTSNHRKLFEIPIWELNGKYSHSWEKMGNEIAFGGKFWVFIGKERLLFFYIPILGICCSRFPKLFPKLGTIWEKFPRYSQYCELCGNISPSYSQNCD